MPIHAITRVLAECSDHGYMPIFQIAKETGAKMLDIINTLQNNKKVFSHHMVDGVRHWKISQKSS